MQVILKDAIKIQNGHQRSALKFIVGAKTLKLKYRNYSNFIQILNSPGYGDLHVIFEWFYWNSKWPPWMNFMDELQGSNFESCVWRTVSSHSSHHPYEVLLAQFSLYVHKGGLKPDSFHFICGRKNSKIDVRNNSHFTITQPSIWKCAGDFTGI